MSDPASILVVRYSALGDVVLATSILEPLRARFPRARIEWVTDALYAPLLEGLPGARRGPPRSRARGRTPPSRSRRGCAAGSTSRSTCRTSCAARWSPARRRRSARRSAGAPPLRAVLSLFGSDPPLVRAHQTRLYAEALAPLGTFEPGPVKVSLSPQARALAADALQGVPAPAVAIAPGARWATKRWPAERFAAVADALAAEGCAIVLCGGPVATADAFAAFRAAARAPRRGGPLLPAGGRARRRARAGPAPRRVRLGPGPPRGGGRHARPRALRPDLHRALGAARAGARARARAPLRAVLEPRRRLLPARDTTAAWPTSRRRRCSPPRASCSRDERAPRVDLVDGPPGPRAARSSLRRSASPRRCSGPGRRCGARSTTRGSSRAARAGVPVVSIGNLAVGGAGKTPGDDGGGAPAARARPARRDPLARLRRRAAPTRGWSPTARGVLLGAGGGRATSRCSSRGGSRATAVLCGPRRAELARDRGPGPRRRRAPPRRRLPAPRARARPRRRRARRREPVRQRPAPPRRAEPRAARPRSGARGSSGSRASIRPTTPALARLRGARARGDRPGAGGVAPRAGRPRGRRARARAAGSTRSAGRAGPAPRRASRGPGAFRRTLEALGAEVAAERALPRPPSVQRGRPRRARAAPRTPRAASSSSRPRRTRSGSRRPRPPIRACASSGSRRRSCAAASSSTRPSTRRSARAPTVRRSTGAEA